MTGRHAVGVAARALSALTLLVGVAACQLCDTPDCDPIPLTLVGTNPWAAQQPTDSGRYLSAVRWIGGHVYVGYGDWNRNTGPIHVTAWDIEAGQWVDLGTAGTEAIEDIVPLDGAVVVPYVDARTTYDYAVATPFAEHRIGTTAEAFTHLFDVIEHDGRWYAIGTQRGTAHGLVLESADGGASWTTSLVTTGSDLPPPDDRDWLTYGVVLDGALWVEGIRGAYRLDPATDTWEPRPPLTARFLLDEAVSIGDRAIVTERAAFARAAFVVDPSGVLTSFFTDLFIDIDVDTTTGRVYALRMTDSSWTDVGVWTTDDLVTWTRLPGTLAPAEATRFDVEHGVALIGDRRSQLWLVQLP